MPHERYATGARTEPHPGVSARAVSLPRLRATRFAREGPLSFQSPRVRFILDSRGRSEFHPFQVLRDAHRKFPARRHEMEARRRVAVPRPSQPTIAALTP